MRVARTSGARPVGRPAKTSSSVRATEAATTTKELILRDLLRGPWIGRTWNWLPTAKSSWMSRGSTNGLRAKRVVSATRDRICRSSARVDAQEARGTHRERNPNGAKAGDLRNGRREKLER